MRISLSLAAAIVCGAVSISPAHANMEQRAADLSRAYLEAWSFDTTAALRHVGELYGPRIRFYGRDLHRAALYDSRACEAPQTRPEAVFFHAEILPSAVGTPTSQNSSTLPLRYLKRCIRLA